MRRPMHAARFVTVATFAAMVGSLLASAPAALAAAPIQGHKTTLSHEPGPVPAGQRSYREVDVSRLPQGAGNASATNPLVGPNRTPAAPQTVLGGAPPPPVLATTSSTPAASEPAAWAGLAASGTIEPPDSGVAAGPNHVVQVAATGVRVTNRSGNQQALVSLKAFFGFFWDPAYQAEAFNPRVLYDTLHNRWIVIGTSFDCYQDLDAGIEIGTGFLEIA